MHDFLTNEKCQLSTITVSTKELAYNNFNRCFQYFCSNKLFLTSLSHLRNCSKEERVFA